jgi:hypothetical protein
MENRAENPGLWSKGKFSKLDWPTPELIVSAHRARGKALREITSTLGHRLWSVMAASRVLSSRTRRNGPERHGPIKR